MSNYVKATNFTAKDSLPSGNSGKIVKGAEIDTELTAVASAISSKADTNSPALTGTPTAPTASAGTNTTQLATTAFVLANAIPSGLISMWSGTIASIPSGWVLCNGSSGTPDLRDRFIVGAGNGYAVGATGGQTDATLVAHTHTINDPGHSHVLDRFLGNLGGFNTAYVGDNSGAGPATPGSTQGTQTAITINSTGSSATNANLPPYYALAYIMKT
jgi:microcystin-dependent protein